MGDGIAWIQTWRRSLAFLQYIFAFILLVLLYCYRTEENFGGKNFDEMTWTVELAKNFGEFQPHACGPVRHETVIVKRFKAHY